MPYHHLLVPTDGSELSARAVSQAAVLARAVGARLTLFHVQTAFPISLVGVGELVDPATVDALIEAGHSLIVVEHNPQLIRAADYLIDLGPGAADLGGRVVACGTPAQVAKIPESKTGRVLARLGQDH